MIVPMMVPLLLGGTAGLVVVAVALRIVGWPARQMAAPLDGRANETMPTPMADTPALSFTAKAVVASGSVIVTPLSGGLSLMLPVVLGVTRAKHRRGVRAARQVLQRRVIQELPEVIDLLALATSAGLVAHQAVGEVASRGSGAVIGALRQAVDRRPASESLADALDRELGVLGEPVRPLQAVLSSSLRYGTALADPLARLVGDARLGRRRMVETQARRLPVLLLLPLVLCGLPSFILLAVVPVGLAALDNLSI